MRIDIFENEQRIYDGAAAHVEAIRNGAPFDSEEYAKLTKEYGKMLKQLRWFTRIADLTTSNLHESNLDLSDKIRYDELTGIYNRRFLEENLKRLVRFLARSGSSLGVLMIDVDYFKLYNDAYGHSEGDICLKTVAKTIAECLSRADDFVARYGGEEFAVILPNTDENGARLMASRIVDTVRARNIPHKKSGFGCITVSVGVTASIVEQTHSGADYVKRADEALYLSKKNGRDQYTYISFEEAKI